MTRKETKRMTGTMAKNEEKRVLEIIESAIGRVEAIHPYKIHGDCQLLMAEVMSLPPGR